MYYGYIVDTGGNIIDEVMMVQMPEGRSYTGQNQAEVFCHGGQFVLTQILGEIFKQGVRPAEPGEFTRRAFLAGRIDLTRAEAVADLIASRTEYSYNAAKKNLLGELSEHIERIRNSTVELLAEIEASIDYPEEELDLADRDRLAKSFDKILVDAQELTDSYKAGRIVKEGYMIAIAGRPNAGKSSLFNLFLNQNRAIVAPTPGTTRDYLTEWIDLNGLAVSITDTAGLRDAAGLIEQMGQQSAENIIERSDLLIWIADISRKKWQKEIANDIKPYLDKKDILLVLNKIDKLENSRIDNKLPASMLLDKVKVVYISCKTKVGLKTLKKKLLNRISGNMPDLTDHLIVTSERHKAKLENFLRSLNKARKDILKSLSPELTALELRQGINEIDEITGRIYTEDILNKIFERFCIGK